MPPRNSRSLLEVGRSWDRVIAITGSAFSQFRIVGPQSMKRPSMWISGWFLIAVLGACSSTWAETKTLARCGAGFLEEVNGYRVLHVKGDPYEMGYQQGALLRDDIRELVHFLFDVKAKEMKV